MEKIEKKTVIYRLIGFKGMGSDLRANEVLMVGDDIRDDVLGAQAAGLKE